VAFKAFEQTTDGQVAMQLSDELANRSRSQRMQAVD
jgi:hypothetical protein